ncbi:hypothetical protein B0I72DRAFT_175016 [Yarrowia lipolytica]|uniref:Uncharacterized protein n=1 Tax=Yarrowia lipolytica TaxID=4952 RepID=A0A371C7P4_YARLL|nr:hypothetical protein BKA91DRAFT_129606 [Yarrowia lipolytica]KAE8170389.1 hypothetical protein BKA90DRAFT_170172 [Yarrowia lipolytica]KAJ8051465.1 hypothetical protein LXG23DRAFT_39174 [Yarrowia lipolytica]RDW26337.1 hypothetical protein B0I71DRAFT_140238 [Yarrowia lipolytica]RDW31925.1 hypothetical protein B0I72DRAFT_175016 [Yarrowia lipolytica]
MLVVLLLCCFCGPLVQITRSRGLRLQNDHQYWNRHNTPPPPNRTKAPTIIAPLQRDCGIAPVLELPQPWIMQQCDETRQQSRVLEEYEYGYEYEYEVLARYLYSHCIVL